MKFKRKHTKILLKYSAWTLLAIGVERWCFRETAGFRDNKILSSFQYEKKWDHQELSEEKKKLIDTILDQPFTYIGHGGTIYCFASLDNKYVIKFFKHQHLEEHSFLSRISLPSFLEKYRLVYLQQKEKKNKHKRKDFLFASLLLAEEKIPSETAIIHLQLNKSPKFKKTITLYDKIGIKHSIPLDQTEFILQKKADLLVPLLCKMIDESKTEEVKHVIDSFFVNIRTRCDQGLHDRDPHPSINFGYVDGQVVEIDIGSFSLDESLKDPKKQKEVMASITKSLTKKLSSEKSKVIEAYINEKLESLYPSDI